jgi:hypothetical protein
MKSFCSAIVIGLLFLIGSKEIYAQTTQSQLNQVELMKQFLGNWECKFGKTTIYRSVNKPFGTGLTITIQIISNGEIIDSVKQLFGYDNKTDKYIVAELIKSSSVIEIGTAWFVSEHAGSIFITDSDGDELKFNFEFITPDIMKETAMLYYNIVEEMEFNRIEMK